MPQHDMIYDFKLNKSKEYYFSLTQFFNEGKFQEVIEKIDKYLIENPSLPINDKMQFLLKKQSALYNYGQYTKARETIQESIKLLQVQTPDNYYLCRFYTALGAVLTKYEQQNFTSEQILQYYYKAKMLYNLLLSKNDERVVYNLQLKIIIFINIILVLFRQMESHSSKFFFSQKKLNLSNLYQIFDQQKFQQINHKQQQVTVNKMISFLIQNLLQIKNDVVILGNKQIIDYYNIIHIKLLNQIITDLVLCNINKIKIHQILYDIQYIVPAYLKIIQEIDINTLSYRNALSFINTTNGLFQLIVVQISYFSSLSLYLPKKQKVKLIKQIQKSFNFKIKNSLKNIKKALKCMFISDILLFSEQNLQPVHICNNDNKDCFKRIKMFLKYNSLFVSYLEKQNDNIKLLMNKFELNQSVFISLQSRVNDLIMSLYKNIKQLFIANSPIITQFQNIRQQILSITNETEQKMPSLLFEIIAQLEMINNVLSCHYYQITNTKKILLLEQFTKKLQAVITLQQVQSTQKIINFNKQILQQKTNYIKELQSSNKILENFAYVLAHDLKTPLRSVLAFSQLLYRQNYQDLNDTGKQSLQMMLRYTKRMMKLVQSSLQYAQIGNQLNKTWFNIYMVIMTSINNFTQKITKKGIIINVDEESIPMSVYADQVLIQNVLDNLLNNSLKACEDGAVITFGFKGENIFYISDTGKGMTKYQIQNIFNLFYKSSYNDPQQSLGLGLAIVKRILDKHDSNISIQSQVGKGTTIYFNLQTRNH